MDPSTTATAIRAVPLLDTRAQLAPIRAELDAALHRVLDHGQFILGPEVRQFEEEIARYCGTKHAVGCGSGSDALLLPLMALNAGPGDCVITTPYTFFATAGSIARLGARPVFVDIEPETCNIDPAKLDAALRALSGAERARVKAIVPVHLYGQCADMEPIEEIASRYGIPVMEDAAQAIGAEYRGRRACSMGWCGTLSFYPSKNLGGLGEGGMVATNDDALADKVRSLRVHGSRRKYYHELVGLNSRLDTLQAAALLVKLPHLDAWTAARRRNAARYRELLADAAVTLPLERTGCFHIYNQFVIRSTRRDSLIQHLKQNGVGSEVYYPVPLHLQECFAYCGYKPGDFPESERAALETLAIPIQPELEPWAIERVAEVIRQHA